MVRELRSWVFNEQHEEVRDIVADVLDELENGTMRTARPYDVLAEAGEVVIEDVR